MITVVNIIITTQTISCIYKSCKSNTGLNTAIVHRETFITSSFINFLILINDDMESSLFVKKVIYMDYEDTFDGLKSIVSKYLVPLGDISI